MREVSETIEIHNQMNRTYNRTLQSNSMYVSGIDSNIILRHKTKGKEFQKLEKIKVRKNSINFEKKRENCATNK